MSPPRDILHVDVDAFFVSVEQVLDPSLRGKPVIVGGNPNERSVVASASYEARRFGIHSGMPLAQARRLCPEAVCISGHSRHYGEYSRRIRKILERFAPRIEVLSVDDFYLDLTGCRTLHGSPLAAAEKMKHAVRRETGLSISIGVASSKLIAKIASDLAKPDGILSVWPDCEEAFLRPLPVDRLPGVGPSTAETLAKYNLLTVGDVARVPQAMLEKAFGAGGAALWLHAHGRDDAPVSTESGPPQSIGRETTFAADTIDHDRVRRVLYSLIEHAAWQLRKEGLRARRVTVKVRYCDFQTVSAGQRLPEPSDQDRAFCRVATDRLEALMQRRLRIRLVGVTLSMLSPAEGRQGGLFAERELQRQGRFYRGLDKLRERFGFNVAHVGRGGRGKEGEGE